MGGLPWQCLHFLVTWITRIGRVLMMKLCQRCGRLNRARSFLFRIYYEHLLPNWWGRGFAGRYP